MAQSIGIFLTQKDSMKVKPFSSLRPPIDRILSPHQHGPTTPRHTRPRRHRGLQRQDAPDSHLYPRRRGQPPPGRTPGTTHPLPFALERFGPHHLQVRKHLPTSFKNC